MTFASPETDSSPSLTYARIEGVSTLTLLYQHKKKWPMIVYGDQQHLGILRGENVVGLGRNHVGKGSASCSDHRSP